MRAATDRGPARRSSVPAAHTLAVVGASGGVGSSTLAVAVGARAARRGWVTTVVDLDARGPGLDVCVDSEQEPGLRWPDLAEVAGRIDGQVLRDRTVAVAGVAVLSAAGGAGPMPSEDAATQVLAALRQASDVVVLDVPRDGPWTSCGLAAADRAIVLAACHPLGLAGLSLVAARVAALVEETFVCLRGRARERRQVVPVVERELGLPVVAWVPEDPVVGTDLERGRVPGQGWRGGLAEAADQVVEVVTSAAAGPADGRSARWESSRRVSP